MIESFQPSLLLSMPQLQDPNFAKAVVLLCDYVSEGAFGLVINQATPLPASEMVRLEPPIASGNRLPLFIGGPVEPERGWLMLSEPPADDEFRTIVEGVYLSTSPELLRRTLTARPAPRAQVIAGYAGWGPGQLEEELAQSAWLMAPLALDLVFDVAPADRWETAIRRLGVNPGALQTSRGVH